MSSSAFEYEPIAVNVALSAQHLMIELADGRRMAIPLEWFPRLMNATRSERKNWRLLGGGYAIEWPDLDEHIGVESVIAGHRSGESTRSLNNWLATRAVQKKPKIHAKALQTKKKAKSS